MYTAYRDRFSGAVDFGGEHAKLKLNLFKDRMEFRRSNRGVGWAEAFYRYPFCYAYGYMEVIRNGGTVGAFEEHIGPLEQIQQQWYEYLCELLKGY